MSCTDDLRLVSCHSVRLWKLCRGKECIKTCWSSSCNLHVSYSVHVSFVPLFSLLYFICFACIHVLFLTLSYWWLMRHVWMPYSIRTIPHECFCSPFLILHLTFPNLVLWHHCDFLHRPWRLHRNSYPQTSMIRIWNIQQVWSLPVTFGILANLLSDQAICTYACM